MTKAKFITSLARIQQTAKAGMWQVIDNELYQDEDGAIYLLPRNFETDNYTIPDWIAWLGGNKSKWDVRPSHFHDFACKYKKRLRVIISLKLLRDYGFVTDKEGMVICKNIPVRFLEVEKVGKTETDNWFRRMMKATHHIPGWRVNLMRAGVFFNVGWFIGKAQELDMEHLYEKS